MPKVTKQLPVPSTNHSQKPSSPTALPGVLGRIRPMGFDRDNPIQILLYGKSASGKTTLWSTFPGPILAMVCSGGTNPGELRSVDTEENREKISCVNLLQSTDVSDVVTHLKENHTKTGSYGYSTLVLDHVSSFQDMVLKEVLGLESLPAQKFWGMASQQLYGQCAGATKDLIRSMLNLRLNVVIVGQEKEDRPDETNPGSGIMTPFTGVGVIPSISTWLYASVDYICQTFIRQRYETRQTKVKVGKEEKVMESLVAIPGQQDYCIRTKGGDRYMTKFRIPKGMEVPIDIPDPTYDKIMNVIRPK